MQSSDHLAPEMQTEVRMSEPSEISAQATTQSAQQNIRTIAKLEHEAIDQRSRGERFSDIITRFMGSMTFVVLHLIWLGAWFVVNLGWIPGVEPFDPFPFGILTLIVSTEGVILAIFVLISQNRMSRLSNQRAHLNLQISLLAEQETTKILQKLRAISERLDIPSDEVVERLSQDTHLEALAEELKRNLPKE
jgi:uncharacterized membrane protein